MRTKTLALIAGAAVAGSIGVAQAEEPAGSDHLFATSQPMSLGELSQANGREALAVPIGDAVNANVTGQGEGDGEDGIDVLSPEFVQNLTTQVANSVATAVATDVSVDAGNIVVGGGGDNSGPSGASAPSADLSQTPLPSSFGSGSSAMPSMATSNPFAGAAP